MTKRVKSPFEYAFRRLKKINQLSLSYSVLGAPCTGMSPLIAFGAKSPSITSTPAAKRQLLSARVSPYHFSAQLHARDHPAPSAFANETISCRADCANGQARIIQRPYHVTQICSSESNKCYRTIAIQAASGRDKYAAVHTVCASRTDRKLFLGGSIVKKTLSNDTHLGTLGHCPDTRPRQPSEPRAKLRVPPPLSQNTWRTFTCHYARVCKSGLLASQSVTAHANGRGDGRHRLQSELHQRKLKNDRRQRLPVSSRSYRPNRYCSNHFSPVTTLPLPPPCNGGTPDR